MGTGLPAFKKSLHKAGELLGNKIADARTNSSGDDTKKQEPVE